jgi:hypothetical protein
MLTFIGNERSPVTCGLRAAMILLALGAICAAVLFASAYIAQLNYGKKDLPWAGWWHNVSYGSAIASVAFFGVAVIIAALSL